MAHQHLGLGQTFGPRGANEGERHALLHRQPLVARKHRHANERE